jgi:GT2 family glycosyltransferase
VYSGLDSYTSDKNYCVAHSKNVVFKELLKRGCDHCFVIEDDVAILDPRIFERYIKLSEVTKIQHFNFGYHGPANKKDGCPTPRLLINFSKSNIEIAFNLHCVGAFSYYSKNCLETVGLMDEKFVNAWEHVDHTYKIIKADMHPPFWWFADYADSHKMIKELACSEVNSTIRSRSDWKKNIQEGLDHFFTVHGCAPISIPQTNVQAIQDFLRRKING